MTPYESIAANRQDDVSDLRNAAVHERLLKWAQKQLDRSTEQDAQVTEALVVLERVGGERIVAIIHAEYLHLVSLPDASGQWTYKSMPRCTDETMRDYRKRLYAALSISSERAYQLLRMARAGIDCYLSQHDSSWIANRE